MSTDNPWGLTSREYEVLQHVAAGKLNKEIGRDLFISEAGVETHLTNAYRKLDVNNRMEAVGVVRLWRDDIWEISLARLSARAGRFH